MLGFVGLLGADLLGLFSRFATTGDELGTVFPSSVLLGNFTSGELNGRCRDIKLLLLAYSPSKPALNDGRAVYLDSSDVMSALYLKDASLGKRNPFIMLDF